MAMYDVCIIGGGPSGIACAITAAQRGKHVILLEQNKKIGSKIYASGNGKCNFGNKQISGRNYYDNVWITDQVLADILKENIEFYRNLGIDYTERNGYLYPISEQASSIVWAMTDCLQYEHVVKECNVKVTSIRKKPDGSYQVCGSKKGNNALYEASRVVLACGGVSYSSLGAAKEEELYHLFTTLGIAYEPFMPALAPLICEGDYKEVSGVRTKAKVQVMSIYGDILDEEVGELQFTDYGVSGICIFNLASYMYDDKCDRNIYIDFFPHTSEESFATAFMNQMKCFGSRKLIGFLNGYFNDKLCSYLLQNIPNKSLRIHDLWTDDPTELKLEQLTVSFAKWLYAILKSWKISVKCVYGFDRAQVSKGGVKPEELTDSFALKKDENIYVIGESLDIIGKCGGYNLMWAVHSGITAAKNM